MSLQQGSTKISEVRQGQPAVGACRGCASVLAGWVGGQAGRPKSRYTGQGGDEKQVALSYLGGGL